MAMETKPEMWETPRKVALLLVACVAVAGMVGFKLGQREPVNTVQAFALPPGTVITIPPAKP